MKYERATQKLLPQLGANGSYIGFGYTVYGVIKAIQNPELIIYICKGLYAEIAIHYNVTISNVERNIRTIVNTIWVYGDRDLLNDVFGKELTAKPRNNTFIDALSNYISSHCESE